MQPTPSSIVRRGAFFTIIFFALGESSLPAPLCPALRRTLKISPAVLPRVVKALSSCVALARQLVRTG